MGSVCGCFHVENLEEFVNPNSSTYVDCLCLRFFIQNWLNVYRALFQRRQVHAISTSVDEAASLISTASQDNTLVDMYVSPPRPLPYDVDPRCFHLQREGLVSRREKGCSHSQESETLRRTDNNVSVQSISAGGKWNGSEGGSKECLSQSSLKHQLTKVASTVSYLYSSSEEEDVCPTCLEEYTPENPRIITRCSHHFHLGCIYEWMERSESCPVCGKVMEFDETT